MGYWDPLPFQGFRTKTHRQRKCIQTIKSQLFYASFTSETSAMNWRVKYIFSISIGGCGCCTILIRCAFGILSHILLFLALEWKE